MSTYSFSGYFGTSFIVEGGGTPQIGSNFMLNPNYNAATDKITITVTDDDAHFDGSSAGATDATQSAVVTNASGTTIASGPVRLGFQTQVVNPSGGTITFYELRVNGTVIGYVTDAEVPPGVTFTISNWNDTTSTNRIDYSTVHSPTWDPNTANTMTGGSNHDSLSGGAGNDTISGGAGADTIDGGTGDDTIYYGQGGATSTAGDTVHGGAGNDYIDDVSGNAYTYNNVLYGDAGNDTIYGGAGNDYIDGGADNDSIIGELGADTIHGGTGNDYIDSGSDNDMVYGEAGLDTIHAGSGADYVDGGADNDLIYGEAGNDTIYGGTGNDTIYGGTGNDLIHGDDGADSLMGDDGDDTIYGDAGQDTITGGAGNDSLSGGADKDLFVVYDGFGNDTIDGGSTAGTTQDDDSIDFANLSSGITVTLTGDEAGTATNGANTVTFTDIESIEGTNYADSINASADSTGVYLGGDAGDDTITGGSGGDTIEGGAGADTVWAGAGDDWISGGSGNDTLQGASGNDTIWGGAGSDELHGGDDADTFTLKSTDGSDTIFGGEGGNDWDVIQLSGAAAQVNWTGWEMGSVTYDSGATYSYFWEIEQVQGTSYADTFDARGAGTGVNVIAGAGDDTIIGSDYADVIDAGAGNDSIAGGAGDDTITTGAGSDTIGMADLDGNDFVVDFDMTVVNGLTTDQLDVSDLHDGDGNPINAWDVTISDDGSGNAVLSFPGGESLTLLGVAPSEISGAQQLYAMGIPCFVAGTRIATPRGLVAVETLVPGDLVRTRDGPPVPVLWAGQRVVSVEEMRAKPGLCPIEFRPGALGNDRVLRLSAQHCVFVPDGTEGEAGVPSRGPGFLARAGHMASSGWGGARRMRGARGATFHHILLPSHALIAAEGAWVESFWPGKQALTALAAADRFGVIRVIPPLAGVIWGTGDPEILYGPRVRPLIQRCQIDRHACAKWSRLLQQATLSDGFMVEATGPKTAFGGHGFAG